jgi:hypothetical protein
MLSCLLRPGAQRLSEMSAGFFPKWWCNSVIRLVHACLKEHQAWASSAVAATEDEERITAQQTVLDNKP